MVIVGSVIGVVVLLLLLFRLMWRVAEPNEALVISGLKHTPESAGSGEAFGVKIIVGKGVLVIPGVQAVRRSRRARVFRHGSGLRAPRR